MILGNLINPLKWHIYYFSSITCFWGGDKQLLVKAFAHGKIKKH